VTAAELLQGQNPRDYLRPDELERWMLSANLRPSGPAAVSS
jgi:hypothetical protein